MDNATNFHLEAELQMKFRIVHLITTIDFGGAEKQLLTLAQAQRQQGLSVEIIFLKDRPSLLTNFLDSDIRVDTSFFGKSFIKQIQKLRAERRRDNVVFHAHLPRAELLCALALRRRSFIITRHNAERFFPKSPQFVSKLLSRFVSRRAFAAISISKAVAKYVLDSGEFDNATRNHVIYYGLKDVLPKSHAVNTKKRSAFTFGTLARLVPQKNLELALSTLREIKTIRFPKARLRIGGSGPLLNSLKAFSMDLGIADSVTWDSRIEDTSEFYKSLDVFILTSNYEGFGLVLLEAMFEGIPVVAREISAIPEVLGESHPGLINSTNPSDFAELIVNLASNSRIREKILIHQAEQLKKFSILNAESKHRKIYEELLFQ